MVGDRAGMGVRRRWSLWGKVAVNVCVNYKAEEMTGASGSDTLKGKSIAVSGKLTRKRVTTYDVARHDTATTAAAAVGVLPSRLFWVCTLVTSDM